MRSLKQSAPGGEVVNWSNHMITTDPMHNHRTRAVCGSLGIGSKIFRCFVVPEKFSLDDGSPNCLLLVVQNLSNVFFFLL